VQKIDLTRFIQEHEVTMSIVDGWGKYGSRRVEKRVKNGWYRVGIGSDVSIKRKATLVEIDQELKHGKLLTGFAYGEEIVPVNFQNLFSRGFGETVKVEFLDQLPWTAVHFVQREDERFYYVDVDFGFHRTLVRLQKLFEAGQTLLNEKGVSPEARYLWLLMSLERDTWKHLQELEALKLSEKEKKKRAGEFKLNFGERIRVVVEQAGGVFISATKQANNRYLVTWKSGRQTVKSVVHENLRVEHAGYCLSNFDKHHSLQSLISLSKIYIEDSGSLYLTRV